MNWVRVSKTLSYGPAGVVEYLDEPGLPSLPPGWYGARWESLEYCAGPCATAEEAMRAVEAVVGEVA
jgi:hypothetical protein